MEKNYETASEILTETDDYSSWEFESEPEIVFPEVDTKVQVKMDTFVNETWLYGTIDIDNPCIQYLSDLKVLSQHQYEELKLLKECQSEFFTEFAEKQTNVMILNMLTCGLLGIIIGICFVNIFKSR